MVNMAELDRKLAALKQARSVPIVEHPKHPKIEVLEGVIATQKTAKVKTSRQYVRLDVATARLILANCTRLNSCSRVHRRPERCQHGRCAVQNYLSRSWQEVIKGAENFNKERN